MAIAHVISTAYAAGVNGATTTAVNMTGVNLIVVGRISYLLAPPEASTSDSSGNTYTALTVQTTATSHFERILYAENPTVSSSHTITCSGTGSYATFGGMGFSGAKTSSAFDQQNGAITAGASSLSTGSVTPTEDNELLVSAGGFDYTTTGAPTINSSFTREIGVAFSGGNNFGFGLAYKIQTTAGAENPTWSVGGSGEIAASIATFKQAAAGGTTRGTPFGHCGTAFNGGRCLQGIIR